MAKSAILRSVALALLVLSASADVIRSDDGSGCQPLITLAVTPPLETSGQLIEEHLPAGLVASNVSDGGAFFAVDDGSSRIRWLFFDGDPRTLSYTLSGPSGTYAIGGNANFGSSQAIAETQISLFCYTLTVTTAGRGTGHVELPVAGPYESGATVTARAIANIGSQFTGWTGDLSGRTNPGSIVMDTDKAITAQFEYDDIFHRTIDHSIAAAPLVSLRITPPLAATANTANTIETILPPGLSASAISAGGVFTANTRTIRWFYFGDLSRTFSYSISGDDDSYTMSEEAIYNDGQEPVSGDRVAVINANNTPTITVTLPAFLSERDGLRLAAGSVTIPSPTLSDLQIALSSGNPAELNVSPTVTIPAGATSAVFDLQIVNDQEIDGDQTVLISATADGFIGGAKTIIITDDDDDAIFNLSLSAGWNLVSFPYQSEQTVAELLRGTAVTPHAWRWRAGEFERVEFADPGDGIWLFSRRSQVVPASGARLPSQRIVLNPGWNLVGPILQFPDGEVAFSDAFDLSTPYSEPIWEWAGTRFTEAEALSPGKGYWVYSP